MIISFKKSDGGQLFLFNQKQERNRQFPAVGFFFCATLKRYNII